MQFIKHITLMTFVGVFVLGCESNENTSHQAMHEASSEHTMTASPKAKVETLLKEAKADLAVAIKEGYAWRDTGKMIKKAEAALAKEEYLKAESIAMAAKEQSKMAKIQQQQQSQVVAKMFK